jgi:hypothetical protein
MEQQNKYSVYNEVVLLQSVHHRPQDAFLSPSRLLPVLRIRDVYPGSRILIFTHPGSRIQKQQQKTGVKIFFCQTFFCSHKFHKTDYYFIFNMLKKKIWPNFPRIIEVFTQKIVTKPSKIWVWDPRSGIRKKPIPDPGSRIQGSKRHQIPDPGSGSATLAPTMEQQNKYIVHNEVVLLQSVHHCPQDAFLRPSRFLRCKHIVSTMRWFSFRASTTVRRMPFFGSYDGTTKQILCPL